jgi:hypothetical protein
VLPLLRVSLPIPGAGGVLDALPFGIADNAGLQLPCDDASDTAAADLSSLEAVRPNAGTGKALGGTCALAAPLAEHSLSLLLWSAAPLTAAGAHSAW